MKITLHINKKNYEVECAGHETLIEVLRDTLGFTGTKNSCNEGECGSCTIIVNGKSVLSCMMLACDCEGLEITTIEGLAQEDELHPIQESFLDKGAVQCGFCTPGMVMATKALLDKNPKPNKNDIESALDGNLCRCTGYKKIIEAVEDASKKIE